MVPSTDVLTYRARLRGREALGGVRPHEPRLVLPTRVTDGRRHVAHPSPRGVCEPHALRAHGQREGLRPVHRGAVLPQQLAAAGERRHVALRVCAACRLQCQRPRAHLIRVRVRVGVRVWVWVRIEARLTANPDSNPDPNPDPNQGRERTSIGPTAKGAVGASAQLLCGVRSRPPLISPRISGPAGRQRGISQLRTVLASSPLPLPPPLPLPLPPALSLPRQPLRSEGYGESAPKKQPPQQPPQSAELAELMEPAVEAGASGQVSRKEQLAVSCMMP